MRDFAAEVERARADLERDRFVAAGSLRALEEAWARSILGLPEDGVLTGHVRRWVERGRELSRAAEAAAHLHEAEEWQWVIGTFSTGSGEGLASMAEVRTLQAAQAWLRAAAGDDAGARALIAEVEGDSNGMGRREARSLSALKDWLDAPAG